MERLPNLMSQTNVQSTVGVERKKCPTHVQAEGNSSVEVNPADWMSARGRALINKFSSVKLSGHQMTFDLCRVPEEVAVLNELVFSRKPLTRSILLSVRCSLVAAAAASYFLCIVSHCEKVIEGAGADSDEPESSFTCALPGSQRPRRRAEAASCG